MLSYDRPQGGGFLTRLKNTESMKTEELINIANKIDDILIMDIVDHDIAHHIQGSVFFNLVRSPPPGAVVRQHFALPQKFPATLITVLRAKAD